jgi:hypothetical protein
MAFQCTSGTSRKVVSRYAANEKALAERQPRQGRKELARRRKPRGWVQRAPWKPRQGRHEVRRFVNVAAHAERWH